MKSVIAATLLGAVLTLFLVFGQSSGAKAKGPKVTDKVGVLSLTLVITDS